MSPTSAFSRLRSNGRTAAVVVAFAAFVDYFTYGAVLPIIEHSPAHVDGERDVALLLGAYAVGVLFATIIFGYFGDRIGLRRVMITGVTFAACAALCFGTGETLALQLLGRILEGIAAAAMWTAGLAFVAARYAGSRVATMGLVLTGGTAGALFGPLIGGTLYAVGGYRLPFLVIGALTALDALLRIGPVAA